MSVITVLRVESKIQSYVLGPLWVSYITGALVSAYHEAWWVAGIHVFSCFYIGWIGKNLHIHQGKAFGELSKGVRIELPTITPDEPDDLSSEERWHLVGTMAHAFYTIIIFTSTWLLVVGTKFYWVILISVVLLLVAPLVNGVVIGLMSINKLALQSLEPRLERAPLESTLAYRFGKWVARLLRGQGRKK